MARDGDLDIADTLLTYLRPVNAGFKLRKSFMYQKDDLL